MTNNIQELERLAQKDKLMPLDRIDIRILQLICEQMTDEEWYQLDDCTVQFFGKYLDNDKTEDHKLTYDIDSFLDSLGK